MLIAARNLMLSDGTKVRLADGQTYQSLRFYRPGGGRGQYDLLKTRYIRGKRRYFTGAELPGMTEREAILDAIRRQRP